MDFSLKQIVTLLESSNTIVLTAHKQPDGDCLGSMLALYQHLATVGKDVRMVLDDDIPALYHFLPGYEAINKPAADPITADLLIVLDASDVERIGKVKEYVNAPILNIDHHLSNTKFADYWHIHTQSAATGEIIFELLTLIKAQITANMATCLYTAIATDCGFFRYANTSAQLMRYAADLIEYGARPHIISEAMETQSLASIHTLGKVLETLELHHQGKIATITLSAAIVSSLDTTEGFINYPRVIDGVDVAIMFKEMKDNIIRVSLRSRTLNVSQLALIFGGGGHARAAGCSITGTIDDVKEAVLRATIKQLTEMIS